MSIQFTCDDCGASLKVNDKLAGKRIKCKACSTVVRVPVAESDEFGDDFLSAEESGEMVEEPRLPPVSRRPVEKKKKKRKSGSSAGTIRVVVGSIVGLAAFGTVALVAIAAFGWFTSRQGVGRLANEVSTIQGRARSTFEAAAQGLISAMKQNDADLTAVEQQFAQLPSTRDSAIAELSALTIPRGVRQGPEIVAAAKEWINSEANFFVHEGPAIIAGLRDTSLPYPQRLAALLPRFEKMNRGEVEANLKLLTAQKTFLEGNRMPIPPDLSAKLAEQGQKLAALQANTVQTAGEPLAGPEPSTATDGPSVAQDRPAVVAAASASTPTKASDLPPGTVMVTSEMTLKPGMIVYARDPGRWSKGEVRGLNARFKSISVKMLDGPFQGADFDLNASQLCVDPKELARTDLPEAEESPFKVAGGAEKSRRPVNQDRSNEVKPPPRDKPGKRVAADQELEAGMRLLKLWGTSWYEVEILETLKGGRVRIHWTGWSSGFDEECARSELFEIPGQPAKTK